MLSPAEDLQWPNNIHGVHALMERDKNLDGLNSTVRLLDDCTHLVGLLDLMFVLFGRMKEGQEKNIAKVHATCVEKHVTSHAHWGKSGVNGKGPNTAEEHATLLFLTTLRIWSLSNCCVHAVHSVSSSL